MSSLYPTPGRTFFTRASTFNLPDSRCLDSNCAYPVLPSEPTDVVVVGGGIHSLIYSIHAKKRDPSLAITVLEKASSPGYKIGESTLTTFGVWSKLVGIPPEIALRLFGAKDGLAFYYLSPRGDPEDYTEFCANGPSGDFVATSQMERKISELLLTMHAQRMGVTVLHGHAVDIGGTQLSDDINKLQVKDLDADETFSVLSRLVVDATGRFRRLTSKAARTKRFEGWNTNAFWAYFRCNVDEASLPFRNYESCNTNHICLPEGWAWIIRLPSWEGSSVPNLMDMCNYLLDLAAAGTPNDQWPAALELRDMFDLKFEWVVSIGFALRSDVVYPTDMSVHGTREAEQKFNWIVNKYSKMRDFMSNHTLIENLYGPNTTWFIRKQLTYQSLKVTSPGMIAIGDACSFTNPLYSPGINTAMGSSVYAAEMTRSLLDARGPAALQKIKEPYEKYCHDAIVGLQRMNTFNYVCMRDPKLGPIAPLWQYFIGTGNRDWQRARTFTFDNVADLIIGWGWGSRHTAYVEFADKVIDLLKGAPHDEVPAHLVEEVLALSEQSKLSVMALRDSEGMLYKSRWAGLLRFYDDDLNYHPTKSWKDVLARRCAAVGCGNWVITRDDWRKCSVCGAKRSQADSQIIRAEDSHQNHKQPVAAAAPMPTKPLSSVRAQ